jgi:hypothetical protein
MADKETMRDWLDAAERLRTVRRACWSFLDLWTLSRLAKPHPAIDRVAADVQSPNDSALSDPKNHDWSILYRGSVLDD